MTAFLRELDLPRACVRHDKPFADAARELCRRRIAAVAVVDGGGAVVGMLTDDDLLRGVFPGYLEALTHTAFLTDDGDPFAPHLATAAATPASEHMRAAETVEVDASPLHVAERFLHSDSGALVAVDGGTFVGILDQAEFCRAILGRYGWTT